VEKITIKNPTVKHILSAIAVPIIGFLLLNLVFILDFLFQTAVRRIFAFFGRNMNPEQNLLFIPPFLHILFAILVLLISWFVLRSKLGTLWKAIYLTVPWAVVLATLGILLYQQPLTLAIMGISLIISFLVYLYQTQQPWIYYYSVILVAVVLSVFTLMGGEI
jgi:hypothetical protein